MENNVKGQCRHCGGSKPCAKCTADRVQRWAEYNRERSRAHKKAYELKNPAKVVASKRAWYDRNRDASIKSASERKKADPDRTRRMYREQYAKDPTPFLVRANRRAARDMAVGGSFTRIEQASMFLAQDGMCANPYCEADLSIAGFHADHKQPVALGGHHGKENRQLLCPTCNHRKCALTNEVWFAQQKELSA